MILRQINVFLTCRTGNKWQTVGLSVGRPPRNSPIFWRTRNRCKHYRQAAISVRTVAAAVVAAAAAAASPASSLQFARRVIFAGRQPRAGAEAGRRGVEPKAHPALAASRFEDYTREAWLTAAVDSLSTNERSTRHLVQYDIKLTYVAELLERATERSSSFLLNNFSLEVSMSLTYMVVGVKNKCRQCGLSQTL